MKGDPTQNITATRDIVAVWKTGVEADRAGYGAAIAKEKEEAARQAAPAPAGSESGLISSFDDGATNAKFGAGWSVSTDSVAAGKSTAEMKLIAGGANGSKGALQITGTISDALPYAWAGAMFSPGPAPFVPANLSGKKTLHFWARGDARTYRVMFFTTGGGRFPAVKNFSVSSEWNEVSMPFSDFGGTDGHDITAILFCASTETGPFQFAIATFASSDGVSLPSRGARPIFSSLAIFPLWYSASFASPFRPRTAASLLLSCERG